MGALLPPDDWRKLDGDWEITGLVPIRYQMQRTLESGARQETEGRKMDASNDVEHDTVDDEQEEFEVEELVDDSPMRILNHVFLGSIDAARNKHALSAVNIGITLALLGAADERVADDDGGATIERTCIQMEDALDERLFERLPALLTALQSALTEADHRDCNVLVHCMAGRSRSPALVTAWLMAMHNYSFQDAVNHIMMIRPWVEMNTHFRRDLELFAAVVHHPRHVRSAPGLLSSRRELALPRLDFGASLVDDILAHRKTVTMRMPSDAITDRNSDLTSIHQYSTVVATTAATQTDQERRPFAFLRIDRISNRVSLAEMDTTTLQASGFSTADQVLTVLQMFYQNVTLETPLLLIHFTCLGTSTP